MSSGWRRRKVKVGRYRVYQSNLGENPVQGEENAEEKKRGRIEGYDQTYRGWAVCSEGTELRNEGSGDVFG